MRANKIAYKYYGKELLVHALDTFTSPAHLLAASFEYIMQGERKAEDGYIEYVIIYVDDNVEYVLSTCDL